MTTYTTEHTGKGWTLYENGVAILRNLSREDAEGTAAKLNAEEETSKAEAEYWAVYDRFTAAAACAEHPETQETWDTAMTNGADTCADLGQARYDQWGRPSIAYMTYTLNTLDFLVDGGAAW